jgi:hypothetical protein
MLKPLIESHLPSSPANPHAIELSFDEFLFALEHFPNFEKYIALKTLAYFGADLTKLNPIATHKYFLIRKWLYIHHLVIAPSESELRVLRNMEPINQAKV